MQRFAVPVAGGTKYLKQTLLDNSFSVKNFGPRSVSKTGLFFGPGPVHTDQNQYYRKGDLELRNRIFYLFYSKYILSS